MANRLRKVILKWLKLIKWLVFIENSANNLVLILFNISLDYKLQKIIFSFKCWTKKKKIIKKNYAE